MTIYVEIADALVDRYPGKYLMINKLTVPFKIMYDAVRIIQVNGDSITFLKNRIVDPDTAIVDKNELVWLALNSIAYKLSPANYIRP